MGYGHVRDHFGRVLIRGKGDGQPHRPWQNEQETPVQDLASVREFADLIRRQRNPPHHFRIRDTGQDQEADSQATALCGRDLQQGLQFGATHADYRDHEENAIIGHAGFSNCHGRMG
ncbi:MAG: hypothetical protein IIC03_10610 [Proteobacteria bacterium]|nr:hypothetical protein [Pseudomonadota bacterium]